jgi:hypothetical protein
MEGKPDHHRRKAVRTPLTPAMSAALRAEIERTGSGRMSF